MEDHKIIALFFERDERAIKETERSYGGYCYAVAKAVLGSESDAEETVSDALLKVWHTIPPQRPASLKLYMAKITRNLAISRWRALGAEKRGGSQTMIALEELGDCVSDGQDVTLELDKKELSRAISQFLRGEKERDRGIFIRRYFYLEDAGTIALRYGLREANVLQILSRTRRKLKQYLIREGYSL